MTILRMDMARKYRIVKEDSLQERQKSTDFYLKMYYMGRVSIFFFVSSNCSPEVSCSDWLLITCLIILHISPFGPVSCHYVMLNGTLLSVIFSSSDKRSKI